MKRIITLGVVVLLICAVYTGAWFWAADQIRHYEREAETGDGVSEPKIACGSFFVGGFPFGFDLTCADATVTMADTTVTVKGLKASAEVYNPTHILVFAEAPVNIADAFTGSSSRLDFASLEGSARLEGWRIGRVSLIVEQPVWNDTVVEDRLIGKADHIEAHLVDLPARHDAKAGLAALGEYVQVDNLNVPGFEIAAGKSTFQGELTNVPDDVRTYDADLARRWQAAGGQFTLVGFTGEDGANKFDAKGNFSLSPQGYLGGQLELHSTGLVEKLAPMIPEQYRGLITGAPAADGSYSQTVNVISGAVFAGMVPLMLVIPPAW